MNKIAKICLLLVILISKIDCLSQISDKYPSLKSRISPMTLITQVEQMMQSNESFESVNSDIIEYINEIQREKDNLEQIQIIQKKECEDEQKYRNKEISSSSNAYQKSQAQLDACNAQLSQSNLDLQNIEQQLEYAQNYQRNLIQKRAQQENKFKLNIEGYNQNSEDCYQAIQILQLIWSGESSFIDLAKHTNLMIKNAITTNKINKLTSVISSLTQLTSKNKDADENLISTALKLLRQFIDLMKEEQSILQRNEEEAINQFNDAQIKTEKLIEELNKFKEEINANLSQQIHCTQNQEAILSTAESKLQRDQGLLDSATKMCTSFQQEYEAFYDQKNKELELISMIQSRVEEKYGK